MFSTSAARLASIGIIAGMLVAATSFSAQAATEPVPTTGSTGNYFLVDSGTGDPIVAGQTLDYSTDVSGSPVKGATGEYTNYFTGPADADGVYVFVAPRGSERTPSAWSSFSVSGFADPAAKTVLLPAAELDAMIGGLPGQAAIKASGGNYSVGLAFTKFNGVAIASNAVYYANITVTPGTGTWTYAVPAGTTTPPVDPTPASGSFTENLQATTIAAADGTLNLVAPANATAIIGNPVLDPTTRLSTSTGNLGKFTVEDGRVVTHKGWTLTTSVKDFAKQDDASTTIDKKQLGIAPIAAAGTTLPAGVTLAAPQVAGSAVYPGAAFAEANATAAIAKTDLDAALTFVAPADKPAGVYTSTLTVTLTSK